MPENEDLKAGSRRRRVVVGILKAVIFLAALAFFAYNARNYAAWAKEKEAARLAAPTPPGR